MSLQNTGLWKVLQLSLCFFLFCTDWNLTWCRWWEGGQGVDVRVCAIWGVAWVWCCLWSVDCSGWCSAETGRSSWRAEAGCSDSAHGWATGGAHWKKNPQRIRWQESTTQNCRSKQDWDQEEVQEVQSPGPRDHVFSDRRPDKSNTNKPPPLSDSRVQHQHTELLFITSTASCDVCFKTHCYIIAYNLLNLTVIPQAVVSRGQGSLLSEHFTFFFK